MKHENDVSNNDYTWLFPRIYTFMEEIKLYTRTSCIVFVSVKMENIFFMLL